MNRIIKYGVLVSCVFWASCQDFLEPKSQSEYVPKLVKSLDELLLGEAYMGPNVSDGVFYSVLGFFDDDVAQRPDYGGTIEPSEEGTIQKVKLAFTWSTDMANSFGGYNTYGEVYEKIVGCNAVLDYIDEVQGTMEEKNRVKLQALALRGYYYFHLVNLYGKPYSVDKNALGVPLQLVSKLSSTGMPRNTVGEVYDQVVADLLEAEHLFKTLPEKEWNLKNNRINLPFIQLVLSRVYLYMENWTKALAYGEEVINNYGYGILDLNSVQLPGPESYPFYMNYFTWENPEVMFLFGNQMDVLALPLTSINVKAEGQKDTRPTYIGVASDALIRAYELTDLRKEHYLIWELNVKKPVYKLPASKMEADLYSAIIGVGWEAGKWGVAFKVTEGYLNAAEAAAMLYKNTGEGQYLTKVKDWMDQLRTKRFQEGAFQPTTISDPDALIRFVREERRRELCFEHHRWFDLRRYGMDEIKHVWYESGEPVEYTLEKNDPGFTLLLPLEAFKLNPSLVQNESR